MSRNAQKLLTRLKWHKSFHILYIKYFILIFPLTKHLNLIPTVIRTQSKDVEGNRFSTVRFCFSFLAFWSMFLRAIWSTGSNTPTWSKLNVAKVISKAWSCSTTMGCIWPCPCPCPILGVLKWPVVKQISHTVGRVTNGTGTWDRQCRY